MGKPGDFEQQLREWREADLRLGLRLILALSPSETVEKWRVQYERHRVLLPPPRGAVVDPPPQRFPPPEN